MLKYILKRLGAGLVSIFVLVTITFFLMHAIPGGPSARRRSAMFLRRSWIKSRTNMD